MKRAIQIVMVIIIGFCINQARAEILFGEFQNGHYLNTCWMITGSIWERFLLMS